jgi:hypothetical protein
MGNPWVACQIQAGERKRSIKENMAQKSDAQDVDVETKQAGWHKQYGDAGAQDKLPLWYNLAATPNVQLPPDSSTLQSWLCNDTVRAILHCSYGTVDGLYRQTVKTTVI